MLGLRGILGDFPLPFPKSFSALGEVAFVTLNDQPRLLLVCLPSMLVVIVKKSLHCTLNWVGCFQHCKRWWRPPTAHHSAPPTATGSGLHVTSSGSSRTATVLTTTDDHPPPPVLPAHHPNTSSHLVPPPPPLQHLLAYRTSANCLLKHVYNYLVYPSCRSTLVVY